MELFDTHVTTPQDDAYPPDANWRHTVAVAWADHPGWVPEHKKIREDKWVVQYREFLVRLNKLGDKAVRDPKWCSFRRATAWHGGQNVNEIRFRIEPLLLTGATFPLIAEDLAGDSLSPMDIETYCRLFFDMRNEDGTLTRSCYMRAYNALPDDNRFTAGTPDDVIWRTAGMYLGYGGLIYMWRWPVEKDKLDDDMFLSDEMLRAAQAHQMENILRGQISNFDLNTLIGHSVAYQRLKHDTGEKSSSKEEGMSMTASLVELLKPHMAPVAKTVDERETETLAMQNKLSADKAVAQQNVLDAGTAAGEAKINEILKDVVSKQDN